MTAATPPTTQRVLPNEVRLEPTSLGSSAPVGLAPGQVLDVRVVEKFSGERGLAIRGQFTPAALPPNLKAGEVLTVQVVKSGDAVVLKIISFTTTTSPASNTLENLIGKLIEPRELKILTAPSNYSPQTVSSNLSDLFKKLDDETPSSPQRDQILSTLKMLADSGLLIEETALESPEKMVEAFNKWAKGTQSLQSILERTGQATKSVTSIIDQLAETSLPARIIAALEEKIMSLLGSELDLGTEPAVPPEESAAPRNTALKQPTPGATPQGGSTTAAARVQHLARLVQLVDNAVSTLNPSVVESAPDLMTQLFQAGAELRTMSSSGANNTAIREQLKQLVQRLITGKEKHGLTARGAAALTESGRTINMVENIGSSNEIFGYLSPFLGALGESQVSLVPVLLPGMLTPLIITVNQPPPHHARHQKVDPESSDTNHETQNQPEKITFSLTLPNLGPVSVSISHQTPKLLITVECATNSGKGKIAESTPLLIERFTSLGYTNAALNVRLSPEQDKILPGVPAWLKQLNRRHVVA